MNKQVTLIASDDYSEIYEYVRENKLKKILLVCDNFVSNLKINVFLEELGDMLVRFSDFNANPLYESVVDGVKVFLDNDCDAIFAIGGGSAMDVAKCIKLYSNMDHTKNYLKQTIVPNKVKLLVIPTTAGTGSEATKYAVIYFENVKQSITHESIIPSTVVFDISVLESLPKYQKKATLMDALCHSIESYWSVNSTEESKSYSREAITLIIKNWQMYLNGDNSRNAAMIKAANLAGKAINITQTTAAHAMCYKLTGLYGIAHGHAAALCVSALWEYMNSNLDKCIDNRGMDYVGNVFVEIATIMECDSIESAIKKLRDMITKMDLHTPTMLNVRDFEVLKNSVNPVRLKNNPISLSVEAIDNIYHKIFEV